MSDSEDDNVAPEHVGPDDDVLPEDILNIMLATDIHLGYNEKDPVRGEDSFIAFEEILSLAKEKDVDMILLGGDLFHDSRPSMSCLHKCMSLIRKYCLGDKPVSFEFLSDQSLNFSHCKTPIVNYEDPNLNVSIPVFSIHGNHDDPSGFGGTCTLDILSASGLVNYFGKQEDLSYLEISPILLSKGITKMALYGLSHVKDARLVRLFKAQKVQMNRPSESGDWFSMLVLHQNRVARGTAASICEEVLPDFLDMVFWGHEHGCYVKEEYNKTRQFYVTQPGSSVATSLSEDEAMRKHVAILRVHGKKFQLQPLPLQTVRPFVCDTVKLGMYTLPTDSARPADNVQQFVAEYMESMLAKTKKLITGHPRQPTLPLLRLRVMYEHESQMFNVIRFGQSYASAVANPSDMVLMRRGGRGGTGDETWAQRAHDTFNPDDETREMVDLRVEELVRKFFENADEDGKLQVLSVPGLLEAMSQFIDKDDHEALNDVLHQQKQKAVNFLVERNVADENVKQLLKEFNAMRNAQAETEEARNYLSGRPEKAGRKAQPRDDFSVTLVSDDDDDVVEVGGASTARGRGRGRARGARAPRAARGPAAKGRGKQPSLADSFGNGNGSRYGSVVAKAPTQRKGMRFSDSDSD